MDELATGEPRWELTFDEDGILRAPDRMAFFQELKQSGVKDLLVFSHGWNTGASAARNLYDDMFPRIRDACADVDSLGPIGFAGVLWPSVWFPETPAVVSGRADSGQAGAGLQVDETSGSNTLSGAQIAESLLPSFAHASDQESITRIGRLIDEGSAALRTGGFTGAQQEQLIFEIHTHVRSLAPTSSTTSLEDSGENALFSSASPTSVYPGIAETFGTTPPGDDTESVGDWFGKAIAGSKDMMRVLSYSIMKTRAGKVGSVGLGGVLAELRTEAPGVRVHLIGHSFGARLVSFALSTVGEASTSPVRSLLLIQGAFSHFAFAHAQDNPFGSPGALHTYADRVRGPLVATYSVFDYAVGRWYPKASFLAHEDTEAVDQTSRWDGMGADGFQAVAPLKRLSLLADQPTTFAFDPGTFYRVDCGWVINDVTQSAFSGAHSDIRKAPVAQLAAATAGAGASA